MTWRAASVASWTRRLKKNGSVPIKSASDRLRRRLAKAASIVWPLYASTTPISIPRAEAAAVTSLEPISKSPEEDNEASELYEAEEVVGVVFPTDEDAALPLNPSKEALHEPTSHIAA